MGPAVAERIVAKLRRKMAKFALMVASSEVPDGEGSDVLTDAYDALLSVGHSPQDARSRIETAQESKKKFKSVEDVLSASHQSQKS